MVLFKFSVSFLKVLVPSFSDLFSAWDWFFIVSPEFLIELENFFFKLLIIKPQHWVIKKRL
jgi:hypothetical protein